MKSLDAIFVGFVCLLVGIFLMSSFSCSKNPGDPIVGPQGPTGATGATGAIGPTGATGPEGSSTRTGFHVITFGDPNDTSAPNSGGLLVNDAVVWDTVTTVPGFFTVRVPGIAHPDDITEVFLSSGSRGRLRHHFEAENQYNARFSRKRRNYD